MKLHALNGELLVAQTHNDPRAILIVCPGADLEVRRQIFFPHDQGVITRCRHRRTDPAKNRAAIMLNGARLAMHQRLCPHDLPAKSRADGLVSKAHAKHWYFPGKITDQIDAYPGILRGAWPGRNYDSLRAKRINLRNLDLVIPPHLDLRTQFAQVLNEVIGERIVVIENEDHGSILAPVGPQRSKQPMPAICETGGKVPDAHFGYRRCAARQSLDRNAAYRHAYNRRLGGPMAETQEKEKRSTRRFPLRLPVSVRYGESPDEHEAQTRDVSARGICFFADSAIQAGAAIDFTLTLPPEITLTESIRVRCKGRVVRVEGGSSAGKMAVAAVIDEYEFLA